jgi:hypothetical protein
MDKYKLKFKLSFLPKLPNQLLMKHWRVKQKEIQLAHRMVYGATQRKRPTLPLEKVKMTYVRVSAREPDHDNLIFSFKHVQDGLVKARIIKDDKPSIITDSHYSWRKGPQKTGHCLITIEEL